MSDLDPIAQRKAELRKEGRARREALPVDLQSAAAQAIAERGLPVPVQPGTIVSGYSPLKFEISPLPLLRRCAKEGGKLTITGDRQLEADLGVWLRLSGFAKVDKLVA